MLIVFEIDRYKFSYFSIEENLMEPLPIHVRKAEKSSKVWLRPNINPENNHDDKREELPMNQLQQKEWIFDYSNEPEELTRYPYGDYEFGNRWSTVLEKKEMKKTILIYISRFKQ